MYCTISSNTACRTAPDDDVRQKMLTSEMKRNAIVMPRFCGLGMEMGRNRASSLVRIVEPWDSNQMMPRSKPTCWPRNFNSPDIFSVASINYGWTLWSLSFPQQRSRYPISTEILGVTPSSYYLYLAKDPFYHFSVIGESRIYYSRFRKRWVLYDAIRCHCIFIDIIQTHCR